MNASDDERTVETLRLAEQLLTAAPVGPMRLEPGMKLGDSDRSHVYRFRVIDGLPESPGSVIVKRPRKSCY
jgi:hypothetical protein